MKNFDNIHSFSGYEMSFFLEKVNDSFLERIWLDGTRGFVQSRIFWKEYDCVDTGFHKSEVEAYKLFCKL